MGFQAQYTFMYLPMDFARSQHLGYAHIDMIDPATALRCFDVFQGFTQWKRRCSKACEVAWSHVQGFQANVTKYRNRSVMSAKVRATYKPIIFASGEPVEFPRPAR